MRNDDCPVEGPNMPESMIEWVSIPATDMREVLAILAELPDERTPSARYLKELILPRLNQIRAILKS